MATHLVLLAGGRGTRFWPLSRHRRPKQFLPLLSERSLLSDTWERVAPLGRADRAWVLTAADLRRDCRRELPQVPAARVLGEPVGRNTAAAVALVTALAQREDPRALLAVFPSDHHIADPRGFRALARKALQTARSERAMVILGIPPAGPETGYGYIEIAADASKAGGAHEVRRFVEKPDRARARRFVKSGRHLWNSGMFFLPADVAAAALAIHAPEIWAAARELAALHGSRRFAAVFRDIYPRLPALSFDSAVLERAAGVKVLPAEVGWSDVGNWNALADLLQESEGNHIAGQVLALDAKGNIVLAEEGLTALVGVDNLVVVRSGDALLVCHRDRVQSIRELVKRLSTEGDGRRL